MSRKLTDEERALWDRTRQTVQELSKRHAKARIAEARSDTGTNAAEAAPPKKLPKKAAKTSAPLSAPKPPAKQKPAPALAPLEARTRRRLTRGAAEVDARIDLHGMRQHQAFTALASFLRKAQAEGHRVVLVVTGKGGTGKGGNGEEGRGVLRQSVPAWLSRPDLRALVVGWEEAGRRHGGAGALYVRIRRRREAGRQGPSP